jgi:hypothetical protein
MNLHEITKEQLKGLNPELFFLAVERIRAGDESPIGLIRDPRAKGLFDFSTAPQSRIERAGRVLRKARELGFQVIGPASIQDAMGAMQLAAENIRGLAMSAGEEKRYTDALDCWKAYLRLHGVRIEEDIAPALSGIHISARDAKIEVKREALRLISGIKPEEGAALVSLLIRMDDDPDDDVPSETCGESRLDE